MRGLVGEGGLYAAYTPVYASLLAKDKKSAAEFSHAYAGRLFVILSVAVVLGIVFARELNTVLLWGFNLEPQKILLAATLTKIMLPFLLFVTLAAWVQATLQAHNRFFFSSLSPIFLSLTVIVFLLYPRPSTLNPRSLVIGLAWATTAGGLLQYFAQLPQFIPLAGHPGISSLRKSHPELRRSFLLFVPYVLTFGMEQISVLISTFFGSFSETGTIAALYNTSRLIQLPLGLIGVGSLVTALPELSQKVCSGEKSAVASTIKSQFRRVLVLELPILAVFILFATAIIRLLYFHGKFDQTALELTSKVLQVTAPSLLFFSLQKVYLSLFYAHRDTKSLVWSSLVQLLSKIGGCALLVGLWGAVGIGTAVSLSSFLGLVAMYLLAKHKRYLCP